MGFLQPRRKLCIAYFPSRVFQRGESEKTLHEVGNGELRRHAPAGAKMLTRLTLVSRTGCLTRLVAKLCVMGGLYTPNLRDKSVSF
jgi:hypothetical protein